MTGADYKVLVEKNKALTGLLEAQISENIALRKRVRSFEEGVEESPPQGYRATVPAPVFKPEVVSAMRDMHDAIFFVEAEVQRVTNIVARNNGAVDVPKSKPSVASNRSSSSSNSSNNDSSSNLPQQPAFVQVKTDLSEVTTWGI